MENSNDLHILLELISEPSFAVRDGLICQCNRQAQACMIEQGTPVAPLLATGREEYELLSDGCLYLQLDLNGTLYGASITKLEDVHLFRLETDGIPPEVKAMSLLCAELRYPVSNLSLLTERLCTSAAPSDAAATDQELCRILRVLNNVSNTERFLSDNQPQMEERDVCSILEELLEESETLLEHAGLKLTWTLPDKRVFSLLNVQALKQAFYNLLDNAARFSPEKGTIHVAVVHSGKLLRISVTDQGEGIPAGDRGSVFSRYTRPAAIEDGRHNLGLGLPLVRAAARLHGGAVLIDTPPEGGTRVTMTLSLREPSSPTLRAPQVTMVVSSNDDGRVMLSNVLPRSLYEPQT